MTDPKVDRFHFEMVLDALKGREIVHVAPTESAAKEFADQIKAITAIIYKPIVADMADEMGIDTEALP